MIKQRSGELKKRISEELMKWKNADAKFEKCKIGELEHWRSDKKMRKNPFIK